MRFKKGREEELTIGIAPLIDIVFLLLIFFMVTSHFDIASGVRIRLPKVVKKTTAEDHAKKVALIIDKTGQIYIEGKKIDPSALGEGLKKRVYEKGLYSLIIQADKDVRHGKVVEIMDLAKNAGVRTIIIAARWKTDNLF